MKLRALSGGEASITPFLNTLAVETWDTWFRWRADGQLRDITIDDTWERVATKLAAGTARSNEYKRRLMEAFAAWRLLLDERVIATAGTAAAQWNSDNLRAVLNAASFVRAPGSRRATFDFACFEDSAVLAMQALEGAVGLVDDNSGSDARTRVGLIGLGDALALLNVAYDSDDGRMQAANIARALARGCLAGSIALAREHGARIRCDAAWSERASHRGYPRGLIEDALRHGLHQREFTAITSQPRLSSFANGVADALDPLPDACCDPADSYAAALGRRARGCANAAASASDVPTCVAAQLRMRATVQPWIDERINYPFNIDRAPSAAEIGAWSALARELDLGPPSWRFGQRGTHDAGAGAASPCSGTSAG